MLVPSNHPDLNLNTGDAAASPFVIAYVVVLLYVFHPLMWYPIASKPLGSRVCHPWSMLRCSHPRGPLPVLISTRLLALFVSRILSHRRNRFNVAAEDGLALAGNAPKVFTKVSKSGLPYVSVIFCSLFSALAYMSVNSGAGKVFGWFANMVCFFTHASGIHD